MASDTFGGVWRKVRLRCPLAPALLVQDWVANAYREACERRDWSWLRAEAELIINAAKNGTVTVVRNSATITGVSLIFAATDVDRQLRIGSNQPVYTVTAVNVGANTATIDRVYGGATATATPGQVLDAYVTMPSDFYRFLAVLDPSNGWQLRYWITEDEINAWDPQRSSTGTPWALASRRLATTTENAGRTQYELWPYATSVKNYPYYYIRGGETLTDDTSFLGVLANRGDILMNGALAEAAEWPGLEGKPNPYFNLQIAKRKRDQFDLQLHELELADEDVYPTWWVTGLPFARGYGCGPVDSNFMQAHDC